ncbi:hypothetical protein LBMAG42_17560 [Deltaproteobacteria bacterium]|nr:hypothetical protein LBMAG42_17560 [Deltaproteobacteria bacterium]
MELAADWLPSEAVWSLPVADTRSALSSVTLRWDDRFGVDATIGADFPIVGVRAGKLRFGFGITAQGNMGFEPNDDLRFDLETFDGTFAFPLDARFGPWSARLDLAHTSAHFADGVRDNAALPASPDGYSREWIRLLASRELGPARLYAGGRALLHDTRGAEPFGVQVGGELSPAWAIAPYLAADVQLADEANWEPALSAQLGVWARPTPGTRARLAVTGRYGPEDTGKLTGQKEAWIGVLFGFDRTGALPR